MSEITEQQFKTMPADVYCGKCGTVVRWAEQKIDELTAQVERMQPVVSAAEQKRDDLHHAAQHVRRSDRNMAALMVAVDEYREVVK